MLELAIFFFCARLRVIIYMTAGKIFFFKKLENHLFEMIDVLHLLLCSSRYVIRLDELLMGF